MNYKQQAEAYIRSQLPELMELSFGCRILNKHLNQTLTVTHLSSSGDCINCFYEGESNTTWIWRKYLVEETFEIIGHPIELNHWLRVLEGRGRLDPSLDGNVIDFVSNTQEHKVRFNLFDGQPCSPADYQAICKLLNL